MNEFAVGDTVRMTGKTMKGRVGWITSIDDTRDLYLVLVGNVTQICFRVEQLQKFESEAQ